MNVATQNTSLKQQGHIHPKSNRRATKTQAVFGQPMQAIAAVPSIREAIPMCRHRISPLAVLAPPGDVGANRPHVMWSGRIDIILYYSEYVGVFRGERHRPLVNIQFNSTFKPNRIQLDSKLGQSITSRADAFFNTSAYPFRHLNCPCHALLSNNAPPFRTERVNYNKTPQNVARAFRRFMVS